MQEDMVKIISDKDGKQLVLINDIKFKTRRTIDWKMVESYLKEYIGNHYEILETSEKVYVGSDFPDEFCHANDKMKLKGANAKAKANMVTAIEELISIATNKSTDEDYEQKHKQKAKYGWYRYDTRFGIPTYDSEGEITKYNVYTARILVHKTAVNSLTACVDVFVSLHRAEGFGLVMAEAMLLGTPVIATNWSANTEFMNRESACMVDYKKKAIEQDIPPFKKGYHWAEADVAQAAAYMKRLCEDSAFYEQKKAAAGAYIREKTKMQHSVSLLEDRLGKILEERK